MDIKKKIKYSIKNALLLIGSAFVTLLILELGFRIFRPQINEHDTLFQYDPILGWTFIPNKKGTIVYDGIRNEIHTNPQGFRDNNFSLGMLKKNKIMVIGDSFVSNISVEDNAVFTEVMQKGLNDIEVFNFGVNGYAQVQENILLKQWLPTIKPDLVIAMIYVRNDFIENTAGREWLYPRPTAKLISNNDSLQINLPKKARLNPHKKKSNPLSKSHLYRFVWKRIKNIKSKHNNGKKINSFTPPELYLCKEAPSMETKNLYDLMKKMLIRIKDTAAQMDVPVVFVIAPSIAQVEDETWDSLFNGKRVSQSGYMRSLPNDQLMQFAQKENLKMIDLLPILQSEWNKGLRLYHPEEQHWTTEGNKLVAYTLMDYLKDNGFLGKLE